MTGWWAQFREIGIPRCEQYTCKRLIWPWQDWISQIEQWPEHHACYHEFLVEMAAHCLAEAKADGYHYDGFDTCRYCKPPTEELC